MDYTFETPGDIKLIILYIIQNFGDPITNGELTDIFMSREFIDYFTMQNHLNDLADGNFVITDTVNGQRHYILGDRGREALEYIHNIPSSARTVLLNSIKSYLKEKNRLYEVLTRVNPAGDSGFEAQIGIIEGGKALFDVRVALGSKEAAKEAVRVFKEKPLEFYGALLKALGVKISGE